MRKALNFLITIVVAIDLNYTANAQVSINTDGSGVDPSAGLEVKFTDKGF